MAGVPVRRQQSKQCEDRPFSSSIPSMKTTLPASSLSNRSLGRLLLATSSSQVDISARRNYEGRCNMAPQHGYVQVEGKRTHCPTERAASQNKEAPLLIKPSTNTYIYIYMSIHFMYMSTFKTARRASTSSSIVAADVTAVARVLKSLTLAERKRNFRRYQKSKCQTVSNSVRQMLHLWTSLFKTYPIYGRDR